MTTEIPLDGLLEKIEEAISNQPIKSDEEEKNYLKCPYYLGYLYKSRKNTSISEEYFFCSRVIECLAPK